MHLLWDYNIAQACWDTPITSRRRETSVYEDTMLALATFPKSFNMEIVILGSWNIWIQRNGKILEVVLQPFRTCVMHSRKTLCTQDKD